MTFRRSIRSLSLALALALPLTVASSPAPAWAQEPGVEGGEAPAGEGAGRPLDGYLATLCLACLALFVVAKSARR
jgi:hypothetical protein